ncbi:hypothetical protein AAFF_G00263560 [Aldrovandia affinis]|uniref:Uncharacterized protein n=1 Tax=Aldrovandia affinis TaxID=143900 RepID=A0AAD7SSY0_9TELE|nr:hypothetical protein AAFF_G00263560 [Aldrovandia affinis]
MRGVCEEMMYEEIQEHFPGVCTAGSRQVSLPLPQRGVVRGPGAEAGAGHHGTRASRKCAGHLPPGRHALPAGLLPGQVCRGTALPEVSFTHSPETHPRGLWLQGRVHLPERGSSEHPQRPTRECTHYADVRRGAAHGPRAPMSISRDITNHPSFFGLFTPPSFLPFFIIFFFLLGSDKHSLGFRESWCFFFSLNNARIINWNPVIW